MYRQTARWTPGPARYRERPGPRRSRPLAPHRDRKPRHHHGFATRSRRGRAAEGTRRSMNDRPALTVHADDGATAPAAQLDGHRALGRAVPTLLISLLERRYLAPFQPSLWQVDTPPDDGARPLLREVT